MSDTYIQRVKALIFAERKHLMLREEEMRRDRDYYADQLKTMTDERDMRKSLCEIMVKFATQEIEKLEVEKAALSERLRNLGQDAYENGIAGVDLSYPVGPNDEEFWRGIDTYLNRKLNERGRTA